MIEAYFRAMQAGREARPELLALFADDAVYIEPFTGQPRTHVGIEAIAACLDGSWDNAPPDLQLTVHDIDVGEQIVARWSCTSPAFPAPVHGVDTYEVVDGRITRLETRLS